MAKLSAAQIKGYASDAGFTGNDLNVAVAVALAESGGNTDAHNGTGKDNSYGLWQINMYGDMGPARRGQFNLLSNDDLYKPEVNAKAAKAIHKSQGWQRGWTTYASGKYLQYMDSAKAATSEKSKNNITEAVDSVKAPLDNASGAINSLGSTVFKGVTNLTGIIVAIAFLVVGVVFLVMSSQNAKKAANVAANVLPGGKVVKSAIKKANKA